MRAKMTEGWGRWGKLGGSNCIRREMRTIMEEIQVDRDRGGLKGIEAEMK